MLRQIFRQLWYCRRGNAWLLVEMTLVAAASWFLINAVWPGIHRSGLPDGLETDGLYAVQLTQLYEGQDGYSPERDEPERIAEDFRRIGRSIKEVSEVTEAVPVAGTLPGLNLTGYSRGFKVDSSTDEYVAYRYHIREAGSGDIGMVGYRQVWPDGAPIEDVPGTVIITEDLSRTLFGDENPVGRRLTEYDEASDEYNWRIAGVIAPVKAQKNEEYCPFVMYSGADLAVLNLDEGLDLFWCFRLAPGTDAEEFVRLADRTWKEDMAYGNWRVVSVRTVEGRFESGGRDTFVWQALLIFLLICILIGVASFAWLRAGERRGEMGVRRAMGASGGRIAFMQLAEVWILYLTAMAVGMLVVANVLILGKIGFCDPSSGFVLQVTKDSLPVLFEPVRHFLAVAGITAAVLFVVVTLSTIVPVAGALRESPADVLKDE